MMKMMRKKQSTPTKEERENQRLRDAFQHVLAQGMADAVDDAILELLQPRFGEGFYDYDN
jgi:hypothetical protein